MTRLWNITALAVVAGFISNSCAADAVATTYPPIVQGGSGGITSFAVDGAGNRYLVGYFGGTLDFNPGVGEDSKTSDGNDVFVTRFDSDGTYGWTQTFGGTGFVEVFGVAVDGGTVYVAGDGDDTAAGIGGSGTFNSGGSRDIFVVALDAANGAAVAGFGTDSVVRFGGGANDYAIGITASGGNVYVSGYFDSNNAGFGGSGAYAAVGDYDALVFKLDGTTGAAVTAFGNNGAQTFGGSDDDCPGALMLHNGTLYALGYTASHNAGFGGVTGSASAYSGKDVFILALDPQTGLPKPSFGTGGVQLFGGGDDDYPLYGSHGLAVNPVNPNIVYVAATIQSYDAGFGSTGGSISSVGVADAVVLALDAATGQPVQSFGLGGYQQFGGTSYDYGTGVAVAGGVLYLAGDFRSTNAGVGGVTGPFGVPEKSDAFVVALNPATGAIDTRLESTGFQKFGGSGYEYCTGVAAIGKTVILVGEAPSANAGVGGYGAFDGTGFNGFMLDLELSSAPAATVALSPTPPGTNSPLTATTTTIDYENDPVTVTYVWKVNGTVRKTTPSTSSTTDTFDLSVAGNGDGGETIVVEVTPNDGKESGRTVSASATVVNLPPAFTSGIGANPNPAFKGLPVSFSVAAADAEGDAVTFAWAFGDGSNGTGNAPQHTYSVSGSYTVTVTVSDGNGSATESLTLNVLNTIDATVAKGSLKLNFAKPGSDSFGLSGTLALADKTKLNGKGVLVRVSSFEVNGLAFDAKNTAVNTAKTVSFKVSGKVDKTSGGILASPAPKFTLSIKKSALAAAMAAAGFLNADVSKHEVAFTVFVFIDGIPAVLSKTFVYSAKTGKSGSGK